MCYSRVIMKLLNGQEVADFIKERQAGQVRSLRQAHAIVPRLAIIRTNPARVVDSYMKLKQSYGDDIQVEVDVHTIEQKNALKTIEVLNHDDTIHGIIVQIPLPDPSQTSEVLNAVAANKDVDGLGAASEFDPATPMAINWLLTGYNIDLAGKNILIVGQGRLVGTPLAKLWWASGLNITTADRHTKDIASLTREADVIVCATGVPGLITKDMIKDDAIIVDAGVATDKNGLIGDVAPDVREMPNITITPDKGGVGPLTVSALFENVIRSASKFAKQA